MVISSSLKGSPEGLIERLVVYSQVSTSARKLSENIDEISSAHKNEPVVQERFERVDPYDTTVRGFPSVLTFPYNSPIFFEDPCPRDRSARSYLMTSRTLGRLVLGQVCVNRRESRRKDVRVG